MRNKTCRIWRDFAAFLKEKSLTPLFAMDIQRFVIATRDVA